ncbi:hypothetical protein ACQ5SO_16925 [Rhodovulum sp. DZ06]|uniref:hypothetical protein n=1 Tax=Rhodovulum sp. DZ06 TaxID=3425126 RepID=UPI003D3361F5
MLRISQEQLDRLGADRRDDFRRRLHAHLAARAAAAGGDPAAAPLDAIIDQGMDEARRFGLRSEAEVVRLIELRTAARPDALAPPLPDPAARLLSQHGADPADRLSRFAAWQQARARRAAGADPR